MRENAPEAWMQSEEREQAVILQKEIFHQYGMVDRSIVPDFVVRSWERSRHAGVDPERLDRSFVSDEELVALLRREAFLLECARQIMETMFSSIHEANSSMTLASMNGITLFTARGSRPGELYPDARPGAIASEESRGTNAIGTCIAERRPIEIIGAEHYLRGGRRWSCSSAPIFDHRNRMVAVLNVSQQRQKYHTHTLGMVKAAAYAITEQLRLRAMLEQQKAILELQDDGILVLARDGRIEQMNRRAAAMLGMSQPQSGRRIQEFIKPCELLSRILEGSTRFADHEALLPLASGPFACFFSAEALEKDAGVVLTLREAKRMRRMAVQATGAKATYTFDRILGAAPVLHQVLEQARLVARGNTTVLLLGESGTGKELFAQSIHNASPRASNPFVVVNCGAMPRNLVESELFGYEDGAFTGASRTGKPGKFELADSGTIFLDEIGEMPMDAQVALLRFLQNGEVTRVGGKGTRTVSVRVIAATNKNLEEAVRHRVFREDLYYRLNVFTLMLPPLRERPGDIELLANFFLRKFARSLAKNVSGFSPEAMSRLLGHTWPGNVRELENAVERMANVVRSSLITPGDLPQHMLDAAPQPSGLLFSREAETIAEALRAARGNVRQAALQLGVSRGGLYVKMKRLGLGPKRFRAHGDDEESLAAH